MSKGINRRDFFKTAAVGGAAVAVTSCTTDPVEEIIPMLNPPDEYVPSVSIHFASVCQECTANCGVIVRTREGRAIKVEGNPKHPLSNGSVCAIGQASMQGLYSPSRVSGPMKQENGAQKSITWEDGKKLLVEKLRSAKSAGKGKMLYIGRPRTGVVKDTLEKWVNNVGGRVIEFDMSPTNAIKEANKQVFGREEIPHYALDKARLLVNFGSDFMESWLYPVQLSGNFATMHAFQHGRKGKFVHISPHMSLSGINADEWISCKSGSESLIALAMASIVADINPHLSNKDRDRLGKYLSDFPVEKVAAQTGVDLKKIKKLAKQFFISGDTLALAGGNSTANKKATQLQIAVNLLNYAAGNIGSTVIFGADYQIGGDGMKAINDAIRDMKSGSVDTVIVENVNPAFTLPKGSGFEEALKKVPFVVSLSSERDETSALAHYHLPIAHTYESWGDSRPRTGVYALQQPVMAQVPYFDTMDLGDLLLETGRKLGISGFDAPNIRTHLKNAWVKVHRKVGSKLSFEAFWKKSLQEGGIFLDFPKVTANLSSGALSEKISPTLQKSKGMTLMAVSSNLHNANAQTGNKSWLLEIPHPITQVVWDSWVEINPDTAVDLGINHGDLVEVVTPQGKLEVAAWTFYGIEKNTLAMPVGLGRKVPLPNYKSSHGKGIFTPVLEWKEDMKIVDMTIGENVMALFPYETDERSGDFVFTTDRVSIKPTGRRAYMVTPDGMARDDIEALTVDSKAGFGDRTQKDRGFVRTTTPEVLTGHAKDAEHGHHLKHRHYTVDGKPSNTSFYKERSQDIKDHNQWRGTDSPKYYDPYKWEMAIDLDRCTGCSACVVACYAENNLAVVGKDRMAVGREMSWLRIERYIEKNNEGGDFETYFTPEMCNQCSNAGCETVCPVYATYHSVDGINAMMYNRCVGTRYCANNCVYKQRRYNWRDYEYPSPLHMQLNPAASTREKGVMEKCNFCYTRIREMKDLAKDQGREVLDGEIKTACQQTCPADAITFGNIMNSNSEVSKLKTTTNRGYTQLEEVNYLPSITYLKKVNHDNRKA